MVLVFFSIVFIILKQARVDMSLSQVVGEWTQQESYADTDGFFWATDVSKDVHQSITAPSCFFILFN